jgi:uncharacterized protein
MKSALQGSAAAQFNLGDAYYYGFGVAKDIRSAIKWYKLSAEQGFPNAIEVLNKMPKH